MASGEAGTVQGGYERVVKCAPEPQCSGRRRYGSRSPQVAIKSAIRPNSDYPRGGDKQNALRNSSYGFTALPSVAVLTVPITVTAPLLVANSFH